MNSFFRDKTIIEAVELIESYLKEHSILEKNICIKIHCDLLDQYLIFSFSKGMELLCNFQSITSDNKVDLTIQHHLYTKTTSLEIFLDSSEGN